MKNFSILVEKIITDADKKRQEAITSNQVSNLLPSLKAFLIQKVSPVLRDILGHDVTYKLAYSVVVIPKPNSKSSDFLPTKTTIVVKLVSEKVPDKMFKIVINLNNLVEKDSEFYFNSYSLDLPKYVEIAEEGKDTVREFDTVVMPEYKDTLGDNRYKLVNVLDDIDKQVVKTKCNPKLNQ